MNKPLGLAVALILGSATPGATDEHKTPYPDGASVYFVGLSDGDTVSSPLTVRFGLSGMGVAPTGITEKENVGQHHLLIDPPPFGEGEDGAEARDCGIINDDNHRHFGGGQSEVVLELPVGEYTLQMVLGDHAHVPFGPDLTSDRITVVVE